VGEKKKDVLEYELIDDRKREKKQKKDLLSIESRQYSKKQKEQKTK
jgi:hypothetical protein